MPPFRTSPKLARAKPALERECSCASRTFAGTRREAGRYASVVPTFAALHLDLFEQPALARGPLTAEGFFILAVRP